MYNIKVVFRFHDFPAKKVLKKIKKYWHYKNLVLTN